MTKKKYANAAEKQKAWRIRHGQKRKVPLEFRRGESLGSSETTFRARKEGETWEEYGKYISTSVEAARKRQVVAGGKERTDTKPGGKERTTLKPNGDPLNLPRTFPVEYYEMRREIEKPPEGRKLKEKKKNGKNGHR